MNLGVTVLIDDEKDMLKGIIAEHSTGKNRADALNKALEILNSKLPKNAEVVDFEVGTYVTPPVTRRAYGVAVAVYNAPPLSRNPSRNSRWKKGGDSSHGFSRSSTTTRRY
ncbi:hypothetical protein [Thermococcus sp. JCM 11816]|uniref:hypothetical protein n=1 Tax=Thermococcus sp. (strain JCM 11816 / KS-1) TaxID=1295125 RepID=UPI0034657436